MIFLVNRVLKCFIYGESLELDFLFEIGVWVRIFFGKKLEKVVCIFRVMVYMGLFFYSDGKIV